ncbi:hypothetical protein [Aquihabitans sp. McL0605]|uniref:hypothetical protein n=1 Tax=Aquihabitans sp. McL0605 TaxID=3415671 RepID=UPI003CEC67EE
MEQQTSSRGRARRIAVAAAAALLVAAVLAPGPASATPQGAPPPDVIAAALNGSVTSVTGCDGVTRSSSNTGFLKVERPNATSGDISVDVSYGGTLVAGTDYDALPDPVTIAAGHEATVLFIDPTRSGTITLTVEPGPGYVVGEPATATVDFPLTHVDAACLAPNEQTVPVGGTPHGVDVTAHGFSQIVDSHFETVGDLPPGLDFHVDGTWTGAATTAGVYGFTARWCLLDGSTNSQCFLEIPFEITVVGAGTDVPQLQPPVVEAPATPATPISDTASYTG